MQHIVNAGKPYSTHRSCASRRFLSSPVARLVAHFFSISLSLSPPGLFEYLSASFPCCVHSGHIVRFNQRSARLCSSFPVYLSRIKRKANVIFNAFAARKQLEIPQRSRTLHKSLQKLYLMRTKRTTEAFHVLKLGTKSRAQFACQSTAHLFGGEARCRATGPRKLHELSLNIMKPIVYTAICLNKRAHFTASHRSEKKSSRSIG